MTWETAALWAWMALVTGWEAWRIRRPDFLKVARIARLERL